jgi:hypothetical protein
VEDEGELPYNRSPSYSDQITQEDSEDHFVEAEDDPTTIIGYLDDLEEEPLPDLMSEIRDQDSDLDMESDGEFEYIAEVSDLETFSNTLAEAQRVAVEAEDQRLKEYNRPKRYHGNSARTKRHHRQIGRELEAKGYRLIKTWFEKQNESPDATCKDSDGVPDSDDCEESGPQAQAVESSPGMPVIGLDGVVVLVDDNEDPRDIQVPLVRLNLKKICGY